MELNYIAKIIKIALKEKMIINRVKAVNNVDLVIVRKKLALQNFSKIIIVLIIASVIPNSIVKSKRNANCLQRVILAS